MWSNVNKTRLTLLLAILFTALGAGVFRTSAILFMAATLCGAPIVGIAVGRLTSRGLRISRQMPNSGMVGDVIRVRFTVSNAGWCPTLLVHARSVCFDRAHPANKTLKSEATHSTRENLHEMLHHSQSKALRARLEDALLPLGTPGAINASAHGAGGAARTSKTTEGETDLISPLLASGARFGGETYWKLARRGEYHVPGAGAGVFDPIGLFTDFTAYSAPQSLIIMPRPLKLHRLELLSGSDGNQQPRGSASVADAAEMNGVRPYRPGEGMRRVHWKATARSNVLHVVEWEEETASGVTILLDVYSETIIGGHEFNTLESSILAAASVASYCLENGQHVAIFWWETTADGTLRLARVEGRHRGALAHVLTALAVVNPCGHPDAILPHLALEVVRQGAWGEALLILGSDRCDWSGVWQSQVPNSARRGLAFDSASFAVMAQEDRSSERKFMDKPAVPNLPAPALPPGVKRVRRGDALGTILEQGR